MCIRYPRCLFSAAYMLTIVTCGHRTHFHDVFFHHSGFPSESGIVNFAGYRRKWSIILILEPFRSQPWPALEKYLKFTVR